MGGRLDRHGPLLLDEVDALTGAGPGEGARRIPQDHEDWAQLRAQGDRRLLGEDPRQAGPLGRCGRGLANPEVAVAVIHDGFGGGGGLNRPSQDGAQEDADQEILPD